MRKRKQVVEKRNCLRSVLCTMAQVLGATCVLLHTGTWLVWRVTLFFVEAVFRREMGV